RAARPDDCKVLANYILSCYPEMLPNLILVDPFDSVESKRRNLKGIREAIAWLRDGHLMGTFPAGEVAHLELGQSQVVDPPWSSTVGRLVRRTEAQVVPIYFDGINGALFHLMGLVHPILRTALIPREMLKRQGQTVRVRVGEPLRGFGNMDDEAVVARARSATYALASGTEHGRTYTWRDVFPPKVASL
ncbi:MAG: glycerol acyltransferase, partial [Myxococcota bacterium]